MPSIIFMDLSWVSKTMRNWRWIVIDSTALSDRAMFISHFIFIRPQLLIYEIEFLNHL